MLESLWPCSIHLYPLGAVKAAEPLVDLYLFNLSLLHYSLPLSRHLCSSRTTCRHQKQKEPVSHARLIHNGLVTSVSSAAGRKSPRTSCHGYIVHSQCRSSGARRPALWVNGCLPQGHFQQKGRSRHWCLPRQQCKAVDLASRQKGQSACPVYSRPLQCHTMTTRTKCTTGGRDSSSRSQPQP